MPTGLSALPSPLAVLFDLDGTLVDTAGEIADAVNDTLAPRKEAVVSVFDSGFVLGDGVWEGLRLISGGVAFLDAHLDRLFEGARAIGTVALVVLALALIGFLDVTRGTPVSSVLAVGQGAAPRIGDTIFVRTVQMYAGMNLEPGNEVRILQNGEGTYPIFWQDLRSARRTITAQFYYCQPGAVADFGVGIGEFGWILEDNKGMLSIAELPSARVNHRYRVYEKAL